MIKCKICGSEFSSVITWKHLKTHNLTVKDYKNIYGEVVTDEYRKIKSEKSTGKNNPNFGNKMSVTAKKSISQKNKGKIPHNKNKKMSITQKELLSKKGIARNQEWKNQNFHPLKGSKKSNETKEKISVKRQLQIITKEQVLKALETKRNKNYDLAFFRGKSHTEVSKKKISLSSKKTAENKKIKSIIDATKRLLEVGYTVVDVEDNFLKIKCNKCNNLFSRSRQYATESKICYKMCHTCYPITSGSSNQEKDLINFLSSYVKLEKNNRKILSPREIDILIPNLNLAIEYNGLYWHSEIFKDKNYHLNKKNDSLASGYRMIHIFEDEWINHRDIVKSRLLSIIKKSQHRIYARKCTIKEIDSSTANNFIKQNHLQGVGRSNVRIGLYYQNQLVSVMTFLKGDISKSIKDWELNRFCSIINTNVVGASGKLFNYFIKNYNPKTIISFSDRRWSQDEAVYSLLGFKFDHNTKPNYWYFLPNKCKRIHRFSLRKNSNSNLSERELRESQGYLRIYDCGSSKWIWSK